MARLMMNGIPLELMDGETASVPVLWIKAVLGALNEIVGATKRMIVISVVGIQSSGKSTLLNTMFGLQLPVSAGRCTRGAYCQVIPMKKQNSDVPYEFILIIDTEGLRSPLTKESSRIHDNELATFVIGLANVTVINIKGENYAEIQDVLETVVHAMLRIKLVSKVVLNPSCVFIHQNMSAANAEEILRPAQTSLLSFLDKSYKNCRRTRKKIQL